MIKKIILPLFILSLVGLYFFWQKNNMEETAQIKTSDSPAIENGKQIEKSSAEKKAPIMESKNRVPASVRPLRQLRPRLKGRELLGVRKKSELKSIENSINPKWKEKLTHHLSYMQDPSTKVSVKPEGSFIKVRSGKGRFVEQVVVAYRTTRGRKSSFRALVDSSNGKILRTWDRTIHEDYFKKKTSLPLKPYQP